jgi:hypothetical protein
MSKRPFSKALEALQAVQDALHEDLTNAVECAHEMQDVLHDPETDADEKLETLAEYLTALAEHLEAAQKLVAMD